MGPDAEFNWCEADYTVLSWVAEPVNSFSNVVFVLLPCAFLATHTKVGTEVLVLLLIQMTKQGTAVHEVARGVMSIAFTFGVIAIAWGMAAITNRLEGSLHEKSRRVAAFADRLQVVGFIMFVAAVICWLIDNYYCPLLQNLPLGLPYPHLHMWWHLL